MAKETADVDFIYFKNMEATKWEKHVNLKNAAQASKNSAAEAMNAVAARAAQRKASVAHTINLE